MKLLQIGFILMLLGLLGCAEDRDEFRPDPADVDVVGNVDNFFAEFDGTFDQDFAGWGEWPTQIVTERESVIEIPANALEDSEGNPVTGAFDVKVLELRTPGEILLAGKATHSYGNLLDSGGEFFISASQNGKQLRLRSGQRIHLRVKDATPQARMELWYLDSEFNSQTGRLEETWNDADDDPQSWDNVVISEWTVQQDSGQVINGFGYECWSDNLNWINIDLFQDIPEEERTDVCVDLPDGFGNVNTAVFLIFEDFNGIIMLPGDPEAMQFCNLYTAFIKVGVPIGAPVKFVVISEQGEDCYYFALRQTVIAENHVEVLEPVKTPFDEIKNIIMGL